MTALLGEHVRQGTLKTNMFEVEVASLALESKRNEVISVLGCTSWHCRTVPSVHPYRYACQNLSTKWMPVGQPAFLLSPSPSPRPRPLSLPLSTPFWVLHLKRLCGGAVAPPDHRIAPRLPRIPEYHCICVQYALCFNWAARPPDPGTPSRPIGGVLLSTKYHPGYTPSPAAGTELPAPAS